MKILFVSRAYPPSFGGIENQNYNLSLRLSKLAQTTVIINKFGKLFLPVFIPYAFLKALVLNAFVKYDGIILGDGILSAVGWALKFFTPLPVICIVHGLDITYKNPVYKKFWVGIFLKRADKLVAVSTATVKAGIEMGLPEDKFIFIPNGVDLNGLPGIYGEAASVTGKAIQDKKILLSVGRLVKRKGFSWFVRNVMPRLESDIVYIIAGKGPEKAEIADAAKESGLVHRIIMTGHISDAQKKVLLNACDIFVQPNIKIDGDMEGFGISVLEAACCEKPAVVSRIEGLQDAVKDGVNGFFVEPGDAEGFIRTIKRLFADEPGRIAAGKRAKEYVTENNDWDDIAVKYLQAAKALASGG